MITCKYVSSGKNMKQDCRGVTQMDDLKYRLQVYSSMLQIMTRIYIYICSSE